MTHQFKTFKCHFCKLSLFKILPGAAFHKKKAALRATLALQMLHQEKKQPLNSLKDS